MITLNQLLGFMFFLGCIFLGIAEGLFHGGIFGAIFGGIICGVIGFHLGKLPQKLSNKYTFHSISHFTSAELRQQLHKPDCFIPNFVLMELRSRGEDITSELLLVLNLMESKYGDHRIRGFAAFTSAYPEIARKNNEYFPTDSFEKCKENVDKLRKFQLKANIS